MPLHPDVKALLGDSSFGWRIAKLDREWTSDDLPPCIGKPWTIPAASYQDGFDTGLEWRWDHIPGGPLVCTLSNGTVGGAGGTAEMIKLYNKHSQNHHDLWMRGWKDGIAERDRRKLVGWEPSHACA